ncbi:MAG: hypothetical protein Ct9H300mP16_00790 [Pseudomonadota bacterium]|nr:MAG: hypothetical protein Ct9H300mP16_00790 [Pseudomonadota bacterium]
MRAETPRTFLPGRCFNRQPGHDRRYGRKQQLGARSVRYGLMRDNVLTIDALLANGDEATFGPVPEGPHSVQGPAFYRQLTRSMVELADRESQEITSRFPKGAPASWRLQHRRPDATGKVRGAAQHGTVSGRV